MAATKEQREIEIVMNGQKVEASLKDMQRAAGVMNGQLRQMSANDPGRAKLIRDLAEMRERIAGTRDELYGAQKASLAARLGLDGITSASGLMRAGFKAAVAAMLPLLAFQTIVDLGRSFLGLVDNIDKVKGSLQQLTGAQGEVLDQMYVRVSAISKTFGEEHNEVIKSANVLMKEFGLTSEEAFDLLEKGYLSGANSSGDMLNQIKEYSTQFAVSGASAEEFIQILAKGEKAGIFSDKAADTVKEFGLRVREQTTATRDALDAAFGQEFTDKIFKGINSGSMSTMDALRSVSKEMNNTQVPASKLQTVIADVFGGAGEDAGLPFIQSLQDVNGNLEDMIDNTNTLTSHQLDQLEAEKLLAEAQAELGETFSGTGATMEWLWTMIKTLGVQALVVIIRDMKGFRNVVVGVKDALVSLAGSISEIFSALIKGDFEGVSKAWNEMGSKFNKAYHDGHQKYEKQAREDKKKLDKQEADKALVEAAEAAKKEGEATRKEKEAAAKKAAAEEEKRRKEEQQKLRKAMEDYKKAVAANELELAKLKIEVMDEGVEKQLAKLKFQHDQELKEIENHRQAVLENIGITEAEKNALLEGYDEERRIREEQFNKEKATTEQEGKLAKQEKDKEDFYTQLAEEEEFQREALEEQFLRAMESEFTREQAFLDLKKQTLEQKLAYLQQNGEGETLEAQRIKNEILKTDKEKQDGITTNAERTARAKKELEKMAMDQAIETFQVGIDLLGKETIAREAAVGAFKAFSLGKIAIDLQEEISAIWKTANQNPLNALIPGSGNIIAGVKTAMAIKRSVSAAKTVAAQQFASGGMTKGGKTVPMVEVGGMWQMMSGRSGGSIGAFAEGGWVNNAQLGLIGERGRELVLPNWMVESPKYANIVGYLESERQKGVRAFADGGMTTGPAPGLPSETTAETRSLSKFEEQLLAEVREMKEDVKSWPTKLEVHNNVGETRDKLKLLNDLESKAFG